MSVRKEDGNDEGMSYKEDDTLVNNPRDFFYAMVDKGRFWNMKIQKDFSD